MTYQEYLSEKRKVENQIEESEEKGVVGAPLFCSPNCQHKHKHEFQYDYSKNFSDPRPERPGVAFLEGLRHQQLKTYDCPELVGELTLTQSPIDLQTNLPINKNFKDDVFNFNYENIMVQTNQSMKFNEAADCFYFKLNDNDLPEHKQQSWFTTKTISLFDKHIAQTNLYGMQYHFHSPSEHSIDGKLLDLELHIVHKIENQYKVGVDSQFSNGVMGFLFKCMPDRYFQEIESKHPDADIYYHDRFLSDMVDLEAQRAGKDRRPLDLTRFVALLNFNRRWSYQGSLTTIPCSEGILWNVIEHVIPITQTTLDKFNSFRKIEEDQFTNRLEKKLTGAVKKT